MKKILKKAMALALMLTLFAASAPQMAAHGAYIPQGSNPVTFQDLLADYFGVEFANNYRQAEAIMLQLENSFPRNRMGEMMYPQDFGGAYYDELGILNILTVGQITDAKSDGMLSALSKEQIDAMHISEVDFSYNELWDTHNLLNELIPNGWGVLIAADNVRYWYI
ncbi:MAG: hypothetical protein FWC67_03995, partial [Defluviitaleaceae bacterium]|nr:hypothetical protein [Defluviitaleaceae bacterium]